MIRDFDTLSVLFFFLNKVKKISSLNLPLVFSIVPLSSIDNYDSQTRKMTF
jgi:hypothetical protein